MDRDNANPITDKEIKLGMCTKSWKSIFRPIKPRINPRP
jgi:hypothetical protein